MCVLLFCHYNDCQLHLIASPASFVAVRSNSAVRFCFCCFELLVLDFSNAAYCYAFTVIFSQFSFFFLLRRLIAGTLAFILYASVVPFCRSWPCICCCCCRALAVISRHTLQLQATFFHFI